MTQPGWVEHDPLEIAERTNTVIAGALRHASLAARDLAAIGVTNQRETTVVWNPKTGRPWYNAIVWQDTRTDRIVSALDRTPAGNVIRERTGLPPATYFSGAKLQWILEHVDGVRDAAARGEAVFGTIDSWVIWNLTGGVDGGAHVTDVTNASRTMLMDLRTLTGTRSCCGFFGIPRESRCPRSARHPIERSYGMTRRQGPVGGEVPVCGDLGDQQAATLGQVCTHRARRRTPTAPATSCCSTRAREIVPSKAGLLTTVVLQARAITERSTRSKDRSRSPARRCSGCGISSGSSSRASEIEALANTVEDAGGAYFVPAFSGLFAPYWRSDARGAIVGLSRFHTRGAPRAGDARGDLLSDARRARRDGGRLGRPPGAPEGRRRCHGQRHAHAAAGGRARRAGRPSRGRRRRPHSAPPTPPASPPGSGRTSTSCGRTGRPIASWEPRWTADQRESTYRGWQKAVERTLNWVEVS